MVTWEYYQGKIYAAGFDDSEKCFMDLSLKNSNFVEKFNDLKLTKYSSIRRRHDDRHYAIVPCMLKDNQTL